MTRKLPFIIAVGAITFVFFIATIITTVLFITSIFNEPPPEQLVNGGVVHIYTNQVRTIFLEDSLPPPNVRHDFVFTHTETGRRVYSTIPRVNRTYSVGSVEINNEIRGGTFGRSVASVELDVGSYYVFFENFGGSGEFVWDGRLNDMGRHIMQFSLTFAPFFLLLVGFIILIFDRKRAREREAFLQSMNS